jgi:ESS family glutamate:Na+ symporter
MEMSLSRIDGILTLSLDLIQTLALAALVLFLGYALKKLWRLLDRLNIPAPVVGGLAFALAALLLRQTRSIAFQFDVTLQNPFMIAFFTTVGLTASFRLLKIGGPQVILFWGLASLLAVLQNVVGVGLAGILGVHPFLGLISGSVTMTGGHGTGLAFGPLFEGFGLKGATTLAVAAATFGLVSGGLIGGPVGTRLINKHKLLSKPVRVPKIKGLTAESLDGMDELAEEPRAKAELNAYEILKYMAVILFSMWVGSLVSAGFKGLGVTLPAYIGAMLAAAVFRNVCDLTGAMKLEQDFIEVLGSVALSLFLAMALMSLKLWELLDLALPMLLILVFQVTMIGLFAYWITYRAMGRDYDAAVMAGGHCGFGLGATPNAIANMTALTEKFGPAPRAFLVIPIVGAFFIDFTNAIIITVFTNILK